MHLGSDWDASLKEIDAALEGVDAVDTVIADVLDAVTALETQYEAETKAVCASTQELAVQYSALRAKYESIRARATQTYDTLPTEYSDRTRRLASAERNIQRLLQVRELCRRASDDYKSVCKDLSINAVRQMALPADVGEALSTQGLFAAGVLRLYGSHYSRIAGTMHQAIEAYFSGPKCGSSGSADLYTSLQRAYALIEATPYSHILVGTTKEDLLGLAASCASIVSFCVYHHFCQALADPALLADFASLSFSEHDSVAAFLEHRLSPFVCAMPHIVNERIDLSTLLVAFYLGSLLVLPSLLEFGLPRQESEDAGALLTRLSLLIMLAVFLAVSRLQRCALAASLLSYIGILLEQVVIHSRFVSDPCTAPSLLQFYMVCRAAAGLVSPKFCAAAPCTSVRAVDDGGFAPFSSALAGLEDAVLHRAFTLTRIADAPFADLPQRLSSLSSDARMAPLLRSPLVATTMAAYFFTLFDSLPDTIFPRKSYHLLFKEATEVYDGALRATTRAPAPASCKPAFGSDGLQADAISTVALLDAVRKAFLCVPLDPLTSLFEAVVTSALLAPVKRNHAPLRREAAASITVTQATLRTAAYIESLAATCDLDSVHPPLAGQTWPELVCSKAVLLWTKALGPEHKDTRCLGDLQRRLGERHAGIAGPADAGAGADGSANTTKHASTNE